MANINNTVVSAINVIKELLETSSSSSDDEDLMIFHQREQCHRVENFIESVVNKYTGREFKINFRIERESAFYLIERYHNSNYYSERKYKGGRTQKDAETEILSFIWFCSNKTSIREVSNLFNLSFSKFHAALQNVLKFMVEEIAPEVIDFPKTEGEKIAVSKEFEKISGFPNVLGCIDGSYISIKTPKHKIKSTYVNRHDYPSITLQAICDANLRFLDVFTGVPSKMHDSRVFKMSFISKELPAICGSKYHIIGDAAYPIREYLLTAYRDYGNLTATEREFNLKFCQTRVKIENAFGVLKCRFRQLIRLDFHQVETSAKFVLACCALHNICIDKNDLWDLEETLEDQDTPTEEFDGTRDNRTDVLLAKLGQEKRKSIKNLICKAKN